MRSRGGQNSEIALDGISHQCFRQESLREYYRFEIAHIPRCTLVCLPGDYRHLANFALYDPRLCGCFT